jgi:cytochrome bd-type quinol oxidase subunit 1
MGIGFLVFDFVTFPPELIAAANDSPQGLTPYIVETIFSYRFVLGTGIVAAALAWMLVLKNIYRGDWFLRANRIFGWMWMPLIPLGPLLGVLLLSSRNAALSERS